MCQSKSLLVLVVLFVSFINPSLPQVTKEQAIELIMANVVTGDNPNYNVYLKKEQCSDEKFNLSPYDQIKNPFDKSWLFFIDTKPQYGWGHHCLYAFVQESTGNYSVIDKNMPPLNYWLSWEEISVPFPHQIVVQHTDTTIHNMIDFNPDPHKYALLICGNVRDDSARWNDLSHVYSGLKYTYSFMDENIFVLSGNGIFNPDSMNLNLDGDNVYYDFDGPCNKDEIIAVFNHLDSVMTDKDIFLFYASTHGDTVVGSSTLTSLRLYNFEPLYDYELDSLVDNLVCSEMIFCIDACYSGGMADDLTGSHRVIQVPVPRSMETIRGWSYFDFFTYGWATAMRGWHVSNVYTPWIPSEYKAGHHPNLVEIYEQWDDKVDMDPDSLINGGNEDDFIQFGEVFNYTEYFDLRTELYGSEYQNHGFRGDLLTLNGIEGRVDTTQQIKGSYLFGRKLTLSPGVTLSKGVNSLNFYLNDSTEILILDSAKLDIYGYFTAITGCSGESFITVEGELRPSMMRFIANPGATINIRFNNPDNEYELGDFTFENSKVSGICSSLSFQNSNFTNSLIEFSGES